MSAYRQMRQYLGTLAHEIAEGQFRAARPHHHLILDQYLYPPGVGSHWRKNPMLNIRSKPDASDARNYFTEAVDPYLSTLVIALQTKREAQYVLEQSTEGHSRKPDLASIETHHVYEVKPDTTSQVRKGRAQLKEFKALLNQGDREYRAYRTQGSRYQGTLYERHCEGKQWTPGTWCPQPATVKVLGGTVVFSFRNVHSSGVVAWKINHPEKKLAPVYHRMAERISADLKRDPRKAHSHTYGLEIRHQDIGLARDMQTTIRKDGPVAAFAALFALVAALVLLPEAVLAVFILAIIQEFSTTPVKPNLA